MLRAFALGIISVLLAFQVQAEQKLQVGQFDIHYSTFASTFLTPEIATRYGIKRSRYNGLLNISIIDSKQSESQPHAVAAQLSGQVRALTGTIEPLTFQTIREGDAIYYLAQFEHRNQDQYHFTVEIQTATGLNTKLNFNKTFYVD